MTFALPSILEAIFNPEFKKSGKSGSVRLPRGMKLGNAAEMSRRMNFIRIIMVEMTQGNDKKSNILRRPAVFSYQAHCYFLGIITESLFVYFFTPSGIKCYTIFNLVTVLCKTLCEFFSLLKCPISIISYSVTSLTHSLAFSLIRFCFRCEFQYNVRLCETFTGTFHRESGIS